MTCFRPALLAAFLLGFCDVTTAASSGANDLNTAMGQNGMLDSACSREAVDACTSEGLSGSAPPPVNAKVPPAHCRLDNDILATCDYQTLCFDGEELYVVVADREADFADAVASLREIEQHSPGLAMKALLSRALRYYFPPKGERPGMTPINYQAHYHYTSWERMVENGPVEWLPNGTRVLIVDEQDTNVYHFSTFFMPAWTDAMLNPVNEGGSVYFLNTQEACLNDWKKMMLQTLFSQVPSLFSENQVHAWLDSMTQRDPTSAKPTTLPALLTRNHVWPESVGETCYGNHRKKMPFPVCAHNARTFPVRLHVLSGYLGHSTLREAFGVKERTSEERLHSPRVTVVDRKDVHKRLFRDPESIIETLEHLPAHLNVSVRYVPSMPQDPREQVALMAETDVLVMMHGAGVTNAMFLSQNSALVEVFPYGHTHFGSYGEMVQRAGINYRKISGVLCESGKEELLASPHSQTRECAEKAVNDPTYWNVRRYLHDSDCFLFAFQQHNTAVDLLQLRDAVLECILYLSDNV